MSLRLEAWSSSSEGSLEQSLLVVVRNLWFGVIQKVFLLFKKTLCFYSYPCPFKELQPLLPQFYYDKVKWHFLSVADDPHSRTSISVENSRRTHSDCRTDPLYGTEDNTILLLINTPTESCRFPTITSSVCKSNYAQTLKRSVHP